MKKTILFLLFFAICCNVVKADFTPIIIHNGGANGHDHNEHYVMADMPDAVYYDSDEHEIIIEADGTSLYYNVEIVNDYINLTVISTQISGYGDSIDVSSLPAGDYTIVITSEFLNEYEGHFTI